eukprot:2743279-Amphidinium_carterae.1
MERSNWLKSICNVYCESCSSLVTVEAADGPQRSFGSEPAGASCVRATHEAAGKAFWQQKTLPGGLPQHSK